MGTLDGRAILIAGGLGDIGNAIAHRLHAEGARVAIFDLIDPDQAADLLAPGMRYSRVDICDRDAVDEAVSKLHRLDVVFSSAATVRSAPFLDVTNEDWDAQIGVNLTGSFNLTQAASRHMAEQGEPGHIVLIGSWVQDVPWPEISAYAVSKAGLKMLAKSAARELAEHRIRVNVLAPGIVNAGLARMQIDTDPDYAARAGVVIPLDDLQSPDQVADAARFLASDEAVYMTGSVLLVDGGCSLFRFDG